MKERNREPTVYCPKTRGHSSGRLESVSIRGSFPSSASADRYALQPPARMAARLRAVHGRLAVPLLHPGPVRPRRAARPLARFRVQGRPVRTELQRRPRPRPHLLAALRRIHGRRIDPRTADAGAGPRGRRDADRTADPARRVGADAALEPGRNDLVLHERRAGPTAGDPRIAPGTMLRAG